MKATSDTRPIRIYTLGRFSIVRNGEPLIFSTKTRKPVELIKILLATGGREVNVAQLTDILWPDSDGDAAHNSLGVTLYRLRKMIGDFDSIQLRDNKLELNPTLCWVDIWEFERQINWLESLLIDQQPDQLEIRNAAIGLLSLCTGPFLKGETDRTIIATRERLNNRVQHALESLGLYCEMNGEWSQARDYYQKGLELNPMLESLYQRLMVCHRELGQKAEAMIVYQRCLLALSTYLNISPSHHTLSIQRSLME